jgi:hypothetical protein
MRTMMMFLRDRRAARLVGAVAMAGCAATLGVVAGPASATTTELRVFSLTSEGHGAYHRHDDIGNPADGSIVDVSAGFRWKTTIPRITFTNEGALTAARRAYAVRER